MGKVLYSATMSLDGYIAGPDGDMSWLAPYLGPNPQVDALQLGIGALLIGGRTFRGDDPNRGTDKEGAFSGTWTGPSFVVTHHPPPDPVFAWVGVPAGRERPVSRRPRRLQARATSMCSALISRVSASSSASSTRSWRSSRRSFSAMEPNCSSIRVAGKSSWSALSVDAVPHATNVWMRVLRG